MFSGKKRRIRVRERIRIEARVGCRAGCECFINELDHDADADAEVDRDKDYPSDKDDSEIAFEELEAAGNAFCDSQGGGAGFDFREAVRECRGGRLVVGLAAIVGV